VRIRPAPEQTFLLAFEKGAKAQARDFLHDAQRRLAKGLRRGYLGSGGRADEMGFDGRMSCG
jgi:hypothetical protein